MDAIDRIRAFNRATLRRVGHVEEAYEAEGFSMPKARVLVELDRMDAPQARALADALGINEGYLSRMLSGLARDGLVARETRESDRRARHVRLTASGQAAADRLNAVSRTQVAHWFDGRAPETAERVAAHLDAALDLLDPPTQADVVLTDLRTGDIGWLTREHAEFYTCAFGFDVRFEALVAGILAGFVETHDPARERAWMARQRGHPVGSIFCVTGDAPDVAKLRLCYVADHARGAGLGQHLVETCLDFARAAGYARMTLWTHEPLMAARRLYAKVGFTQSARKTSHMFGQDVVEEVWDITL